MRRPDPKPETLQAWLKDARRRTLELTEDLVGDRLLGPCLPIVNPPLWEIGHLAWFQERWCLRHRPGGELSPSLRPDADLLYDSMAVPHDTRWNLPLPSLAATHAYLQAVLERVLERLQRDGEDAQLGYFVQLAVFHEDMHGEAFAYSRQTLAYPAPPGALPGPAEGRAPAGDVELPGGTWMLGASPAYGFVFDNEKWAHPVEIAPFRIARTPVTNSEFAAFVADGGYERREFWSEEGWAWRQRSGDAMPCWWRAEGDGWLQRRFDQWLELVPQAPVLHVNWHEAQAWCRWAGRRLPTEAEWEMAAAWTPDGQKRTYPWGDEVPQVGSANLDGRCSGPVTVDAFPGGDSACGCRQMLGNVWEWTDSLFGPYPGFVADPYRDYSQPWFQTHRVLRGGCFATRSRLIRNTWRNFYTPDRSDVFAGFRTCAL